MKRFLTMVLVFFVGLLGLVLIRFVVSPYYSGNPVFGAKLAEYRKMEASVNTAVFGSSRMYRHIDPLLLDSLLGDRNVSTYNFADRGSFNPESYFLYERFLDDLPEGSIRLAYLELQELNNLTPGNALTTQGSYWNSPSMLRYCLGYIAGSDLTFFGKWKLRVKYLMSFLYRIIDLTTLKYLAETPGPVQGIRGFYALDEQVADGVGIKPLLERYEEVRADSTEFGRRRKAAGKIPVLYASGAQGNAYFLKYLNRLIDRSAKKGIHLVLVLPPRLDEPAYRELVPVVKALPQAHAIELASLSKYPELYEMAYTFDVGHLNSRGANFLTTQLAEETRKVW